MIGCSEEVYTLPEINFIGGETQTFVYHTYFYRDLSPHSLSNCSARFSVVSFLNKGGSALITKNMTISEDTESEELNVLTVELAPSDTVNLAGKYIYQISIRGSDGKMEIPKQGIMNITNNIDRGFVSAT